VERLVAQRAEKYLRMGAFLDPGSVSR
jgi:hypothetical protein